MKLARIDTDSGVETGRYENGTVVTETGRFEVGVDATLRAPCDPGTLYCVGRNYAATLDIWYEGVGHLRNTVVAPE